MQVILDGKDGRLAFQTPQRMIRADYAAEVPAALAAMETARSDGLWLAGAFAYELGYALEPRLAPLMPTQTGAPLILFGVYAAPSLAGAPAMGRAYAGPLRPEWDAAAYGQRFDQVKEAIAAGDIYQANLSFRARFAFAGDPRALYEDLRAASQAPYCAFLDFFDEKIGAARQILSLSPELFFDIADGRIRARPMKGTAPRRNDDVMERAALAASAKDRAENLMIVDLIRNDLGRLARTGSVEASDLFAIETYPTLHTMVSTVTAQLRPGITIAEIATALFPCGSITGAPKIRAMEILRQMESSPRGAYCGALGYFAPLDAEQDGQARFNVSIRTLTISGGAGTLGLGGGVVQDSAEQAEYAECLLKARFFEASRRPLELIETLKFDGQFVRLDRHLARMAASAEVFGLAFDAKQASKVLEDAVQDGAGALRVRLTLNEDGVFQVVAAALPANPPHWTYTVSRCHTDSSDLLLRHKTSWRELYDAEAARHVGDEVLFCNERGEITEGARSNIFVKRDQQFLTPALAAGVLPGILRAEMLDSGICREACLTENDLAGDIYFGNSLRGLIRARPL